MFPTCLSGQRIVVIATDDYLRSWLSQMISPVVTPMRAENPHALRKVMETLNVTAVISDGAMYSAIAPIIRPYGVPLILIAATPSRHVRWSRLMCSASF